MFGFVFWLAIQYTVYRVQYNVHTALENSITARRSTISLQCFPQIRFPCTLQWQDCWTKFALRRLLELIHLGRNLQTLTKCSLCQKNIAHVKMPNNNISPTHRTNSILFMHIFPAEGWGAEKM